MAHDHSTPVTVDQEAIQRAEQGWEAFATYGKWGTTGVIVILVLMAIFLV